MYLFLLIIIHDSFNIIKKNSSKKLCFLDYFKNVIFTYF